VSAENYAYFYKLLQQETGLAIGSDKAYLLESRLAPVCRRHGAASVDALLETIKTGAAPQARKDALNAMMTHESFFFRDIHPFDEFRRNILPQLVDRRSRAKHLRIWCAAASTGQEPYSLGMVLADEAAKLTGWRVEIVATDISQTALAYARDGLYSQFEVQRGLPVHLLVKYFAKEGDRWRIKPAARQSIDFREFNLLDEPAKLGTFDAVFCRNVLIYFDQPTKARVLAGISRQIAADGFLFLGGSETVLGVTNSFASVAGRSGVYAPALAPAA
jgi:chemotaxis protein methyltransferase CheR